MFRAESERGFGEQAKPACVDRVEWVDGVDEVVGCARSFGGGGFARAQVEGRGNGPGQRVLAAAGTDQENVHDCNPGANLAFACLLAFDGPESKCGISHVHHLGP